MRLALLGIIIAACTALLMAVAPSASAATGSPSDPLNRSDNPVLATSTAGWSIQEGGKTLARVPVTDHVAAQAAAQVTSTASTTRLRAPREPVVPGEVWTFAADVKAAHAGARVQITASWYNAAGTFLSWSGGSFTPVDAINWTRVAATLTAPAGAAQGETVINWTGSARGQYVWATQHDVRAPTAAGGTPTTTPTTTATPPPPVGGDTVFDGGFDTGDFSQYAVCQTRTYNAACAAMPGGYSISIEPGHVGQYAGRFEVRDGDIPSFGGGERAQAVAYDTRETEGTEFVYDWSVMIDQQYPTNAASWQTILQWHSTQDGSPPVAFYTEGHNLLLQMHPFPGGPYDGVRNIYSTPFVQGQWIDLRLRIRWSADPSVGSIEVWRGGQPQTFTDNPTNGDGTPCIGATRCHVRTLYPGDAGNRAMLTYYRDAAISGTGVVHHDNFVVTKP